MKFITFAIVWLLLGMVARAEEPIKLKEVYIDFKSFFPGGTDPLITNNGIDNRTLGQELDLNINTDIYKYFYWNTTVLSETDRVLNSDGSTSDGQFRMVGLQMGLGVDLRKFDIGIPLMVGYYHRSRHELDGVYPWPFPREDGIEIRLYLYEEKK